MYYGYVPAGAINLDGDGVINAGVVTIEKKPKEIVLEQLLHRGSDQIGLRRNIVFSILGRMCHLLADMSVASHTHNNEHGIVKDMFEENMRVGDRVTVGDACYYDPSCCNFFENCDWAKYWDDVNIYEEKGGIIMPPDKCENPIYYLAYSTNQIADHYADFRHDGDNTFVDLGGEYPNLINSLEGITTASAYSGAYYYDELQGLYHLSPYFSPKAQTAQSLLLDQRNNTFTYAVRATAGLLYWFAREAGLLIDCPENRYFQNITMSKNYFYNTATSIYAGQDVDLSTPPVPIAPCVITSGADVSFTAGNYISLMDGFQARGTFHSVIDHCPEPCTPASQFRD